MKMCNQIDNLIQRTQIRKPSVEVSLYRRRVLFPYNTIWCYSYNRRQIILIFINFSTKFDILSMLQNRMTLVINFRLLCIYYICIFCLLAQMFTQTQQWKWGLRNIQRQNSPPLSSQRQSLRLSVKNHVMFKLWKCAYFYANVRMV